MNTAFHASRAAHAKLNIRLEVGARAGPLHTLVSAMASLELADELRFVPRPGGFAVRCEGAELAERDNLVWQACQALGVDPPDVLVTVRKRIPMQAGLGGGSADAAAALDVMAQVLAKNDRPLNEEAIRRACAELGSDVPAAMIPGLKIVVGTGERVTAYPCSAPPWGIVLLKPAVGSNTARAYALLDQAGPRPQLGEEHVRQARAACAAFAAHDFTGFLALLHNDFTEPIEGAFAQIVSARRRLEGIGARGTIVCGSGSCVAGFFEDLAAAQAARAVLSVADDEWCTVTRFHV